MHWLSASLALAMSFLAATPAAAQRTFESDEVDRSLRRSGSIVKSWVKRPTGDADAARQFNDYFDRYYFPAMTQASPEGLEVVGKLRSDLFGQYLEKASPDIQRQLTEKSLAFAKRVAGSNRFHPAVRYNAVLILGGLGASYPREGAEPLPEANSLLCRLSKAASAKKAPPYMQAGALVGLARHAMFLDRMPQSNQTETVAALVRATKADSMSDHVQDAAQNWLRGRAALGLAAAAQKVKDPRLVGLLVKLISDDTLELDTRAAIAASLEGLALPENGSAAVAVLSLAGEVAKDEASEAEEFEDIQLGGRRGGRSGRSQASSITSDRYRFDTEASRVIYVREGLVARLKNLDQGLMAVAPSAGKLSEAVSAARAAVDSVMMIATDEDKVDLDISVELRTLASAMSRVATTTAPQGDDADAEGEGLF